jgi:N-acetylmuramoyl-L-alanine amidase
MRCILAWVLALAGGVCAADSAKVALIRELLRDPSVAEWRALARFDSTLTRADFEGRLDRIFDPDHGLRPYIELSDTKVVLFSSPARRGSPLVEIQFAPSAAARRSLPVGFISPTAFSSRANAPRPRPLQGLRIAIDPADIGGRWAKMEDRSVYFRGYGLINEGDLNLIVGKLLRDRLVRLGASVFLVRDRAEPVVALSPNDVLSQTATILRQNPALFQEAFRHRVQNISDPSERRHIGAELLLTKALETRARVALVRRSFQPDLTIVLQHNATTESMEGRLTGSNRNIFFVHGAYLAAELAQPEQRFRLMTKLLENVTPTEIQVAAAIARRFQAVTGFAPVLYGNSATTLLVSAGNPYVVARNLAFNREHDGPVVVTEPYFMNQPETLARLLAGDFSGRRVVAGKPRVSIFREYADCVASGIVEAYARP